MAAIIRLKRKATDEPAEGLVIELKKPKCTEVFFNEVLFKFAATLNSEKESVRDHIQAALCKEKTEKFSKWRDPKNIAISQSTVSKLCEKLKAEHKKASEKKKLDYLNNRRLVFKEEFQDVENLCAKDAEVRQRFHLYDIIEENEDVKKQWDEMETITCNGKPLVREKVNNYVYDVYIAAAQIDPTFVDGTVSVRPCTWTSDDIYSGDSDDSEECYEDEDDSNDENNWRNDYPEENSDSEKGSESDGSHSSEADVGRDVANRDEILEAFNHFDIDDDNEDDFDYSRILQELREEYDED